MRPAPRGLALLLALVLPGVLVVGCTSSDGDATSGSKRGHLSVGNKRLPAPLEATVGKAAFQPLDTAVDQLLNRWATPMTKSKVTVKLRQKVTGKAKGSYRKLVLATLSTETP